MGSFSLWHWLIVLIVVLLVFGGKRLRNLGGDLGSAIKGFQNALNEQNAKHDATLDKPSSHTSDSEQK